jgi:hypothetical protein
MALKVHHQRQNRRAICAPEGTPMESLMKKTMFKTFLVVAALAFFMIPAHADQIYVCQSCTAPPGGDPNVISNTGSFDVGVAGSATLESPLLIVVGVYDGSGTPSIAGSTTPTIGTYGLTATTATFTSSSVGSAFAQLGLSAGGSENFGNWSGADTAAGFAAPTSFTLYTFAIDTELTSTPITVNLSGAGDGSFILAYSCIDDTGCDTEGDVAQTVFTNTGLVDSKVPEPSSLGLLGLGLLGLVAFTVRRPAANLI